MHSSHIRMRRAHTERNPKITRNESVGFSLHFVSSFNGARVDLDIALVAIARLGDAAAAAAANECEQDN